MSDHDIHEQFIQNAAKLAKSGRPDDREALARQLNEMPTDELLRTVREIAAVNVSDSGSLPRLTVLNANYHDITARQNGHIRIDDSTGAVTRQTVGLTIDNRIIYMRDFSAADQPVKWDAKFDPQTMKLLSLHKESSDFVADNEYYDTVFPVAKHSHIRFSDGTVTDNTFNRAGENIKTVTDSPSRGRLVLDEFTYDSQHKPQSMVQHSPDGSSLKIEQIVSNSHRTPQTGQAIGADGSMVKVKFTQKDGWVRETS